MSWIDHTDSSRLSLEEFCFRSHCGHILLGSSGKFRNLIDALRTIYWFHGLRIHIGASSVYQMEKELEPSAFKLSTKEDQSLYRKNKWGAYQLGRHTPMPTLVAAVEKQHEGAQGCFNHVLWDILRLEQSVASNVHLWIRRLDPDVQMLLWQKKGKNGPGRIRRKKLGKRDFLLLQDRAGVDALACLTLLLREAHAEGNSDYAYEISFWLCRMLLVTGLQVWLRHGIAVPLHQFYELAILPLGAHDGLQYSLSGCNYRFVLGLISHCLYHLQGVDADNLNAIEECRYINKIMSGDYGYDYFFLTKPVPVPVDLHAPRENPLRLYTIAEQNIHDWAFDAVSGFRNERLPPGGLLSALAAAERTARAYQKSINGQQTP